MYEIVTFFIYFKVHPCMDNNNVNTRHKPALFTKNWKYTGGFFFRKRMLILSAIVLKGPKHDLR